MKIYFFITIMILFDSFFLSFALGQNNKNINNNQTSVAGSSVEVVNLEKKKNLIEQEDNDESKIIITAPGMNKPKKQVSVNASIISNSEIKQKNPDSTAFIFDGMAGVYSRQTEYGGGGPTIRGLYGNRVLLLTDGIRINTCITKAGNNQYISLFDLNSAEKIELIRGPLSVNFGSDALGGVVNLLTFTPEFNNRLEYTGRVKSLYNSSNNGYLSHLSQEIVNDDFVFWGGGSYSRLDDINASERSIYKEQNPSGYSWAGGTGKLGFQINPHNFFYVGYQFHRNYDVYRYDRLVGKAGTLDAGKFEKYIEIEQSRQLAYGRYVLKDIPGFSSIELTALYQKFKDITEYRKVGKTSTTYEENKVNMMGFLGKAVSPLSKKMFLTSGFNIYLEKLYSNSHTTEIETGEIEEQQRGAYQGGSRYNSFNYFLQADYKPNDKLTLTLGGNFNHYDIFTPLHDGRDELENVHIHPNAVSGLLGGSYAITKELYWNSNVGTGFRAPSFDDLTILGISKQDYEIPNPNLKPEYCVTTETSVKYFNSWKWHLQFTAFYTWLFDAIEKKNATFNGSSEYDNLDVLQRQNVAKAFIWGGELEYKFSFTRWIETFGTLGYALGEDTTNHVPLSRCMPLMGQNGIKYKNIHFKTPMNASVYIQYSAKQDKLSPEDLTDDRIQGGGTPWWCTLNLALNVYILNDIMMNFQFKNITDEAYRMHGAGLDSAGRHFIVGLDWTF